MASQDKTDFRWDGRLSGAVNNLYYDLINVDVVHTPYSRTHRNSSFFLKTRLGYVPEGELYNKIRHTIGLNTFEVTDVKIIRDTTCSDENAKAYFMVHSGEYMYIFSCDIDNNGCYDPDSGRSEYGDYQVEGCGNRKFFTTDYARGKAVRPITGSSSREGTQGIQINSYEGGKVVGLFSTEDIEAESGSFNWGTGANQIGIGDYLVITDSRETDTSGFAGQVRMITDINSDGQLVLDSPWLGFRTLTSEYITETGQSDIRGGGLKFMIFHKRGSVVGFSNGNSIYLITDPDRDEVIEFRGIASSSETHVIGVADANNKIFILTDNGYVQYSNSTGGYNKLFVNDSMMAGPDKSAIIAYRDIILAFGKEHISVGVPDTSNQYWTMYNQSSTIGLWSRYSFTEYDGDMIFISNDKRLLRLVIAENIGRYMLGMEEARGNEGNGSVLNSKLSTMIDSDEVSLGSYNNDLRIFVLTKESPYRLLNGEAVEDDTENNMTHIYKYNTLFKMWTEDHLTGILMTGVYQGLFYGRNGVYMRSGGGFDQKTPNTSQIYFKTIINAYLIENENNGMDGHPDLFTLAKLNALVTTLGPGVYTNYSKIHIQTYWQGIGLDYYLPVNNTVLDDDMNVVSGNKWIEMISRAYRDNPNLPATIDDCQLEAIQDSQTAFQPCSTSSSKIKVQSLIPDSPWCNGKKEYMLQEHGICINDKLYRFAPTMPLVTNLGETQNYSTQIKIELTGENGDIICFGGFLAELFIAPIGTLGPDGEYELSPETDC